MKTKNLPKWAKDALRSAEARSDRALFDALVEEIGALRYRLIGAMEPPPEVARRWAAMLLGGRV